MPKLSVITVNYNNYDGLNATLQSLWRQAFVDYELIVIDGGSTDLSTHLLASLDGRPSHVVSEPDDGPYDAMNKGLALASGSWVVFMNSGDCFHAPHTLATAMNRPLSAVDMMFGQTVNRATGKILPYKPIEQIHTGNAFCHQSVFYRRDVHNRFPYDTSLKISADFKATLSMLKAGARIGKLDMIVAAIDVNGISGDVSARIAERDGVSLEVASGQPVELNLIELT